LRGVGYSWSPMRCTLSERGRPLRRTSRAGTLGVVVHPDSRIGTDLGPYHIESVIGRGGMGVVYLATHSGLDRRVALKLLTPDYADDEAFRARFLRESKLAASIDHPNIIPIYDAGEIEGTYFIAMRYVEGTDLETRLRSGPLAPREAVHLLAQVASALDAAADAGLVHRDVKPANILIASGKSVDRADHAYLTDFGLTKHRGSQTGLTRAGGFMGTLEYIAPEQIEGKPVDGRADQYALTAIAVGCLTGEPPYPRDSDVAIINAHLHDVPPAIHLRQRELPSAVDAVIARGLAKRPEGRYPDCKSLVDDLRAALGVTDTQLRPGQVGFEDRRVPIIVGLLIVVGILGAVGFGLASGLGVAPGTNPSDSLDATASVATASAAPTEDVFPNSAESALLDRLPPDLAASCVRGPYEPIGPGYPGPDSSVTCAPSIDAGVNSVTFRQFRPTVGTPIGQFEPSQFVAFVAGTHRARGQDCSSSSPAYGEWELTGSPAGFIVCFVDGASGDAFLYWTYDEPAILVRAINQRGDSSALYEYFTKIRRFIAP
jgi:serine/threonine protein kinase